MPRIYQLPPTATLDVAHRLAVDAAGNADAASVSADLFAAAMPGAILGRASSTAPAVTSATTFTAVDGVTVGWVSDGRDVEVIVDADVIGSEDTRGELAVVDADATPLVTWPFFCAYGSSIVQFHRSTVVGFPVGAASVQLAVRVVFGTSVKVGLSDDGFGPHSLTVRRT